MDEALRKLDGLSTVIHTDEASIPRFIVASAYETPGPCDIKKEPPVADEDDEEEESILSSRKERRIAHNEDINGETEASITGTWTVTVGCEKGWWSTLLDAQALSDIISIQSGSSSKVPQPTRNDVRTFSDRIALAFDRKSMLFGGNRAKSPSSWGAIKLYLDLDANPIDLKLRRLSPTAALEISTKLILTSSIPSNASSTTASAGSSSFEVYQLQRKLESTQQALREERHKYRSLLAAPSAASTRTGQRPVVGLGPSLPSASQRSQLPPSSLSSGSRSRGVASSSSGAGPSSDDLGSVSGDSRRVTGSQRTLSLVNPTRVQRANPGENEGFVGDEDEF